MTQSRERVFSNTEALRFGWQTTLANLRPLLALGLVGGFLELLHQALARPSETPGLAPLLALAVQLLQALLFMVYLRVVLQLCDGHRVDLGRPQALLAGFFGYLLTTLLLSLIVLGGLVLLIVPGLMWAVRFGYAPFLVVDTRCDPIEALRESAHVTLGARWQLFGFALLVGLVNLLGVLALGVGLLVTIPTGLIAAAHVMRGLQARAASAPATPAAPSGLTPQDLPA